MIKLAVFDLDNTLAKLGKGITQADICLLKQLETCGVRIAICSGKPIYYLCGFMRQIELKKPILVGENGSIIQFGVDLPPKQYYVLDYSEDARISINFIKNRIDEVIPGMWYQPNEVALTPFPKSKEEFDVVATLIDQNSDMLKDIEIYRHIDSFDIVPAGISKYTGLDFLGKLLCITREETVAFGDGVNDYPMFSYAGLSIGVNLVDPNKANVSFSTATEALQFLINKLKNRN